MSTATIYFERSFHSDNHKTALIKLVCTASAGGTFDPITITEAHTGGLPYWNESYRLANAWAKNPGSGYPTSAAVVTITDANSKELVGAIAGDTLTLSTSASGLAQLSIDRSGSQRLVTSALTIAIASVGASALSTTIYLELERF